MATSMVARSSAADAAISRAAASSSHARVGSSKHRDDRGGTDHPRLQRQVVIGRRLERLDDPRSQARAEHAGATVPVRPRDDDALEQLGVVHGVRRGGRLGEDVLGPR